MRLDEEFKGLVAAALTNSGPKDDAFRTTDIESIGIAVLERIRVLAAALHHKVNLGEDEPLIRVVLAGFVPQYGPEVWVIDYRIKQDALGNVISGGRACCGRVTTSFIRRRRANRKTLMEVRYPPENRAAGDPELLDLLQQNDSRVAKIRAANPLQEKELTLVTGGQSQKADAAVVVNFLKSALPATTPPETEAVYGQSGL